MTAKKGNFCLQTDLCIEILFVLNFLLPVVSTAQIQAVHSISVVQKFELPSVVLKPSFIHFFSSKYPDLLYFNSDSSVLSVMKNNGMGIFKGERTVGRTSNVTSITVGNINDDGIDDIIIVHREQNNVEVLVSKRSDSTYEQASYSVNFYPENVTIGDLNNDKIPDIMSYGKLSSGISFLQGKGKGKFKTSRTLFENIPVSDLSLIALNGDNIVDVALHNWLINETILYLGLGKLKFSEQTVLSFSEDSVRTLFEDFNGDKLADVAVSSAKDRTIQILEGDGLGNFSFSQALPIYSISSKLLKGSFQGFDSKDIVLVDGSSNTFSLFLNKNNGKFYDEIVYGIDPEPSEILVGDVNGDGLSDIVRFGKRRSEYCVTWNSSTEFSSKSEETSFAVGLKPNNLFVLDLNGDGKDDIVVSNLESSTLSVLMSNTRNFSGQISLETPEKPVSVSLYAKTDSTVTLYTVHQENPKISLITLRKEKDSLSARMGDVEQFSISLPEKPITVLPDVSYMEKGISLYAFMSSATNSIIFYQQVKGTRFITKSLMPVIPSKIVFSTINDLNNDGKTDLLYVYSDINSQNNLLGVTLNDSTGNFKGKVYSTILPDSTIKRAMIFIDDFNGDQNKDCLLYTEPDNSLRLSLGNKENQFERFESVEESLAVKSPDQIQTYDFDNDGILDILFADRTTDGLMFFRGKGNGKFYHRVRLADLPKESIFRCGDFNGDSAVDIAYTNPTGHTITVIYGIQK